MTLTVRIALIAGIALAGIAGVGVLAGAFASTADHASGDSMAASLTLGTGMTPSGVPYKITVEPDGDGPGTCVSIQAGDRRSGTCANLRLFPSGSQLAAGGTQIGDDSFVLMYSRPNVDRLTVERIDPGWQTPPGTDRRRPPVGPTVGPEGIRLSYSVLPAPQSTLPPSPDGFTGAPAIEIEGQGGSGQPLGRIVVGGPPPKGQVPDKGSDTHEPP